MVNKFSTLLRERFGWWIFFCSVIQEFSQEARIVRPQVLLRAFRHNNAGALRKLVCMAALALPARRLFRQLIFLRGNFFAQLQFMRRAQ